jgi:predicted N-acyltransferase
VDEQLQVTVNDSMAAIDRDAWNRLANDDCPFLSHEFLNLAETSGCVSSRSGWQPRHLTLNDGKRLRAAMPLYEKSNSWGEFVFDWAWANAYEQSGLSYYPKLVAAIPFTPAPGRRILLAEPGDLVAAKTLLAAGVDLAAESNCSSLHVLFPAPEELELLRDAGFMVRKDCQFHWHNSDYTSFDDFLNTFTAAKRKKVRRDRRRVQENGIRIRRLRGTEIDASVWSRVYELISRTFLIRGNAPYFNEAFFREIAVQIPTSVLVVLAEFENEIVAAAVFFESDTRLYGRYWGSDTHYDSLHFETCYYQGIDYCIETGKQVFEPGTQGEHKISRGFTPIPTWSAHWLAHSEFSAAIECYVDAEAQHVERYIETVAAHTPYKSDSNKP